MKISIIGAGYLGNFHCKLLKQNQQVDFVGLFDANSERAKQISQEYNVKSFATVEETVLKSDAVFIVVPTVHHFEIAKLCLENGKHCFIEKPVTSTASEAKQLVEIAKQNPKLKIKIGHIERFNPAMKEASKYDLNPMFIEAHRLSQFRPRATDISVVHDLMIHDIDLALWLVKSKIKTISANGISVITNTVDIANARLCFENGAVANLTASRLSATPLRKIRFFQKFSYVAADLSKPDLEVFRLSKEGENNPNAVPASMLGAIDNLSDDMKIVFEKPEIIPTNAMEEEQKSFISSILNDTVPLVTLKEGALALEVAEEIMKQINF